MRWLFVCALVFQTLAPALALGQEQVPEPQQEQASAAPAAEGPDSEVIAAARAEFVAGTEAFERGHYEEAVDYWRRSFELSGKPELLFNIGHALDRLGRNAEAIDAFSRFLEESPDISNRAEVEARVQALRESEASAEVAPPDTEDHGTGPLPATLIVAGGVLAVAGGVLLGVAIADKSAVEGAPDGSSWADYESRDARVTTMSAIGSVLLGVGLAAAIAGVVWVVAGADGDESAELAVIPGGVLLRGRF